MPHKTTPIQREMYLLAQMEIEIVEQLKVVRSRQRELLGLKQEDCEAEPGDCPFCGKRQPEA